MYCLAGVGGLLSGFVQSAKDAPQMVAIDGCSIGCARSIPAKGDVPLKSYLVVTELGIDKNHDVNLKKEEINKVKEAVRRTCNLEQPLASTAERPSGGCCG